MTTGPSDLVAFFKGTDWPAWPAELPVGDRWATLRERLRRDRVPSVSLVDQRGLSYAREFMVRVILRGRPTARLGGSPRF